MTKDLIKKYGQRVKYTPEELEKLHQGGHRIRHIQNLARKAWQYSIVAQVIKSCNCNSGHEPGQKFVLDVDGNFITKYCPKRMCVYLISQLTVPVALINERLSEGLEPNDFHFMHQVRCPDVGVDCMGYGEVMLNIEVVPRLRD